MAQNPLNVTIAELIDVGLHCTAGLTSQGVTIGILQYTPANYSPVVTVLQTKQLAFNNARTAFAGALSDLIAQRELMRAACLDARLLLMVMVGREWSQAWVEWGWEDQSTEVPHDLAALKALCVALKNELTEQSDYEIATVKCTFTTQRYEELLTALVPLEQAVTDKKVALGQARSARTTDEKKLRTDTRGLIDLLGTKLPSDDARWDAFGLNRPGADTTPAAPVAPTLTKIAGGDVLAEVPAQENTTYYRWFAKLEGVDPEFRFLGRTNDPTRAIDDLPANGTLIVKMQAANPAGPSAFSEETTIELGIG